MSQLTWTFALTSTLVVALGFASACGAIRGERRPAPAAATSAARPIRVAVTTAARGPVERTFEASGTVRGRNTAVLTSRIVAGLREVRVRAGDHVRAGQVLAELEDADAQATLRRARADLQAAVAGQEEAEHAARASAAAARVAGSAHVRMTYLLGQGAVTKQAFEEAEARQQTTSAAQALAEAQVRAGLAHHDEARAAIAGAEAVLGYTRITAPFAGKVIERRVDPGSQAAPGMPLLVVEQEGPLHVEVAVDESHANTLSVGTTAHVEVASADQEAEGRVVEVVPALDPTARAFMVKVELGSAAGAASASTAPPQGLRAGMFARVRFPMGLEDRLTVPVTAIRPSGDLDRLFVAEGGRAWLRLITLGRRQGGSVEVLAGLDPGETVLTAPPAGLVDGARIEVRP